MAETRLSVHVYDSWQYQKIQFLSYTLKSAEKFGGPIRQVRFIKARAE